MRSFVAVGATVLASVAGSAAQNAITFSGFPAQVTYQDVATLDASGKCTFSGTTNDNPVAPLNEEFSAIIRGPAKLAQFAVYQMSGGASKRSTEHRHGHQHFHERNKEVREAHEEKRANGDPVTAVIDGKVETFVMNWGAGATPAAAPAAGSDSAPAAPAAVHAAAPAPAPKTNVASGAWGQTAYYNAASQKASGLTFLANNNWANYMGLGAVLGYVTANGQNSSATSTVLADTLIPDGSEIVISSDKSCSDGSCGTVAPGAEAFHGFDGTNKIFMFEFEMPMSGARGQLNDDMPAIWLLNSKIINNQQYAKCSCWRGGCGEWDLHEVLEAGAATGSASFHMGNNYAGTPSTTFTRPSSGSTMKMAAIVTDSVAHIQILDDSHTFDSVLQGSTVSGWVNSASSPFAVIKNPLGSAAS